MVKKERGEIVRISINVDDKIETTEIMISCKRLTPEIERIIATLRILDQQLTVHKLDEMYIIDSSKVLYMEAVDRKTFVYTKNEVYESTLKLYELEERLESLGFLRVSKSCILQLKWIKSLRADFDRKIRVTMENEEQIIVSRQYSEGLKRRLGVK